MPEGARCETPTGYAAFPGDALLPTPPRSRVELVYNLVHWTEMASGGHFAAMEKPAAFADDAETGQIAAGVGSGSYRHKSITHCLRSEEHTSELQSLMRNSYAVFCLKKKKNKIR